MVGGRIRKYKKTLLVAGLGLVGVGLFALVALWPRDKDGSEDFDAQRGFAPQEPILGCDVEAASEADKRLDPSELVLGVQLGPVCRAYPLNMLAGPSWRNRRGQEVVNDTLGSEPILVTWCELCHYAVVFSRRVKGRVLTFGADNSTWKDNLVVYDKETHSRWSQFAAEAKEGPLRGERLRAFPVIRTDWRTWYKQFPASTVGLLPRNVQEYRREVYDRFPPEKFVLGLVTADGAWAWTFKHLKEHVVLNDMAGTTPVLAVFDPASYTARLYDRTLAGHVLTFVVVGTDVRDEQTGSTWSFLTGEALQGPLAGQHLLVLPATISYLKDWRAFAPPTAVVK